MNCQPLQWLPRDVIDIIYRYIFGDLYRQLILEYKAVWFNDPLSGGIYWDDAIQGFVRDNYGVANWRYYDYVKPSSSDSMFRMIYKFDGTDRLGGNVYVPARYFTR